MHSIHLALPKLEHLEGHPTAHAVPHEHELRSAAARIGGTNRIHGLGLVLDLLAQRVDARRGGRFDGAVGNGGVVDV